MGIAELVPGVSGGTIAFVTGIYEELIGTLAGLRPGSLGVWWREGFGGFWRHHNLSFLLVLGSGMVFAVVLCARLLGYLLDLVPPLVWAFFFGLIGASVVHVGRRRAPSRLAGYGLLGLVLAGLLFLVEPRSAEAPLWMYFVGGMLAVSAWLLPAVSGSFLLLALGLYEPVLRAFNAGQWVVPLTLAGGCVVGLLAFSRALQWLMSHFREPLLALLTGFMAGSLARLWPWHAGGALQLPAQYQATTGEAALVFPALLAAALGAAALWCLGRLD